MQSLSSPIDNAKAKIMFRSKPLIQFIKVSLWYKWEEHLSKTGFAQPKKSYNEQSMTTKSNHIPNKSLLRFPCPLKELLRSAWMLAKD
jgi:hypothetical protein